MNTITIDYFGAIPNDIFHIILSFVDSLKDSFSFLLVSKRFYHLVKPNQLQWKVLCLQFWKDFKQQLTQQGNWNYSEEGKFDLEWVQRESGKDWFWFSQCFINGRIFEVCDWWDRLRISSTPEKKENGWGILVYPEYTYIGNIINDKCDGHGTTIYHSGVKYEGEWNKNYFHGKGTITYLDGIQYEGQWNWNKPGCMDCFIF